MSDVELGERDPEALLPLSISDAARNRPGSGPNTARTWIAEFTDGEKRRLLGTLCPKLELDETTLGYWDDHLRNLFTLVCSFQKEPTPEGSWLIPSVFEGTVDAITSAIDLCRRYLTSPWYIVANRLRPLQETSGLETNQLVVCVVFFWFRIEVAPWEFLADWRIDRSLVDNVESRFPSPTVTAEASYGHTVSHDFTFANLSRFYGVRLERTKSLDQHLKLNNHDISLLFPKRLSARRNETTLMVFCDTLALQQLFTERLVDGSPACPLPRALYFEICKSFRLLFPRPSHCTKYFGRELTRNLSFYYLSVARERNLSRYEVFGARLNTLLDIYNSPTTHWWHPLVDRRNKREHFTLWIAIWAFLFGFFSLLTGLVSGIYAVKQYELGLAAACAESGDNPRMAKYCV